jgi:hypothetical protein
VAAWILGFGEKNLRILMIWDFPQLGQLKNGQSRSWGVPNYSSDKLGIFTAA